MANTIPLIPLVWITLIEYWQKCDNHKVQESVDILKILVWICDAPKNKANDLKNLIAIKNKICSSYYLKEIVLNTCGFATEWVPSIWTLENLDSFLFTFKELTNLANYIGPLDSILRPISTNEVYEIINDFVSETNDKKLWNFCKFWSLCIHNM